MKNTFITSVIVASTTVQKYKKKIYPQNVLCEKKLFQLQCHRFCDKTNYKSDELSNPNIRKKPLFHNIHNNI